MPSVTIGIPTYRRPELLRRAVSSALAQDHRDLEVVISDNASGDETATVCREMAAADSRVRVIEQPVNVGPTLNFIAVLEAARGELFMWLGDDDWIDPHYISACVDTLSASPDVVVVSGIARNYHDGVLESESRPMNIVADDPSRRVVAFYRAVEENAIFYGVMRRSMLASCTLVNTLAGDWLLMAQVAFLGKIRTNPDVAFHRERRVRTSQSLTKIIETLRLPRTQELLPITSVVLAATRDVLRTDAVFGELGRRHRVALASSVGAILLARLGVWNRVTRVVKPIIGVDRARRWKRVVFSGR